jgi:hypothetical protein
LIHDWSKPIFLNSSLIAIILAKDLSSISMLAINVAIFIFDHHNVVFSDFCLDSGALIGLDETIDPWEILAVSVLVFTAISLVICDRPFEGSSFKGGELAIWRKDFAVKVEEVSDDNSSLKVDSIDFSVWSLIL